MDWNTLFWSLALFGGVSGLAWYLGRCNWEFVTFCMDYEIVGNVRRAFGRPVINSGPRASGSEHDPDLAFRRSIRLPQSIGAVVLLLVMFYWLLGVLIFWNATSHYENSIRVTPTIFAEMGLPHEGNKSTETGEHVVRWLDEADNEAASLFLFQLTGQKDSAVFKSEVKGYVKAFLESENQLKTTPVALQRLLVKIGGQHSSEVNAVEDNAVQVRNFLRSMLLRPDLTPANFEQMVTNLNIQGTLEANTAADRSGTPHSPAVKADKANNAAAQEAPTDAIQARRVITPQVAYLAAIKHGLATKFEEHPGLKVVSAAIYERVREEVVRFRRVRVLYFGEIQAATIALYLLALVLLGSRARVLATQRQILESRFDDFMADNDKDKDVKLLLQTRPGTAIVPDASPMDATSTDRELKILGAYKGFLDRKPHCKSHSFVIGALYQIYNSWESIWAASTSSTSPLQMGREVLSNLVDRNEARLERVEYSLIDYLVWAMPSLGFIGTVVGISQALGDADEVVRASDQASQAEAITLVTSVLGLAFDTTLIALVCTIPVMLLIAWYRSGESQFLLDVDQRISAKLFR